MKIYPVSFDDYLYDESVKEAILSPMFNTPSERTTVANFMQLGQGETNGRRIEISGTLTMRHGETQDEWYERQHRFVDAHTPGVRKLSIFGDRYLWASVSGPINEPIHRERIMPFTVEMMAGDPYIYREGDIYTEINASSLEGFVDASGTGERQLANADLHFQVDSFATGALITVVNRLVDPDGVLPFSFIPDATGVYACIGSWENPSRANRIYRQPPGGGAETDVTRLLRGRFLKLAHGVNHIEMTLANCAVSSAHLFHHDRIL